MGIIDPCVPRLTQFHFAEKMVNKRAIRRDCHHFALCILDGDLNQLPIGEGSGFEGHIRPPHYFLEYIGHLKSRQCSPYNYRGTDHCTLALACGQHEFRSSTLRRGRVSATATRREGASKRGINVGRRRSERRRSTKRNAIVTCKGPMNARSTRLVLAGSNLGPTLVREVAGTAKWERFSQVGEHGSKRCAVLLPGLRSRDLRRRSMPRLPKPGGPSGCCPHCGGELMSIVVLHGGRQDHCPSCGFARVIEPVPPDLQIPRANEAVPGTPRHFEDPVGRPGANTRVLCPPPRAAL